MSAESLFPRRSRALVVVLAVVLVGCTNIATVKPPVRPIDHACLPAGQPGRYVPVYAQDVSFDQISIATVDSLLCEEVTAEKATAMLEDLRHKGSQIGADALVKVRLLSNERGGYVNNPRTPFPSVIRGTTNEYFLRATAVRFTKSPAKRPTEITAATFAGRAKQTQEVEGGLPFSSGSATLPSVATPRF